MEPQTYCYEITQTAALASITFIAGWPLAMTSPVVFPDCKLFRPGRLLRNCFLLLCQPCTLVAVFFPCCLWFANFLFERLVDLLNCFALFWVKLYQTLRYMVAVRINLLISILLIVSSDSQNGTWHLINLLLHLGCIAASQSSHFCKLFFEF